MLREARIRHPRDARIAASLLGLLWRSEIWQEWLDIAFSLLDTSEPPQRPGLSVFVRIAMKHGRTRQIADLICRHGAEALGDAERMRALVACCAEGAPPPAALPKLDKGLVDEMRELLVPLMQSGRDDIVETICQTLMHAADGEGRALVRQALFVRMRGGARAAALAGDVTMAERRRRRALELASTADERVRCLIPDLREALEAGELAAADRQLAAIDREGVGPDLTARIEALRGLRNRLEGGASTGAESSFLATSVDHYPAGGDACMIWFLNGSVEQDPGLFDSARKILRRRGVSLLTVTDIRRFASIDGFGPHAGDFPAAARALKELTGRLGYERIGCMGSSLAASSAVRYSTAMGGAGALCFSGFFELPDPADMPTPGTRKRALRLLNALQGPMPSIPQMLEPCPGIPVHYHYCENAVIDRVVYPRFATLRQVRCFAHSGNRHAVIQLIHEKAPARQAYLPFLRECGLIGEGSG